MSKQESELKASIFNLMGNSVMLSSITGLMRHYMISRFPSNFFKYTYISNSTAGVTEANLDDDNIVIKEKPSLYVKLNIDLLQPDAFAGDSLMHTKQMFRKHAYTHTDLYQLILYNEDDRFYISSVNERTKLSYEFGIKVESEFQALNIARYIQGNLRINRPFYINGTYIETAIPGGALNLILYNKGYDISTQQGLEEFHKFLHDYSGGNITFKKNLASGNFIYFFRYRTNILCKITDNPSIEKIMEGKSVIESTVKFTMEVEFHDYLRFITEFFWSKYEPQDNLPIIEDNGMSIIYNFTTTLSIPEGIGTKLLANKVKILTELDGLIDTIDLLDILNENQSNFISYLMSDDIKDYVIFKELIMVIVYRDDQIISEVIDYYIDWENRSLKLISPLRNYVYTIALYIDNVEFNNYLYKFLNHDERFNNSGVKENTIEETYIVKP
jgi:hypothetical protein